MAHYCSLQEAYNIPAAPRRKKSSKAPAPEEPYDPYTEIQGREQPLFERFEVSHGVSTRPVAGAARGVGESGFESSQKTYASQVTDYDYICKTAGICMDDEPFQNYETVPSSTPGPAKKRPDPATCTPLSPPPYEYPLSEADKARFRKALHVALEDMETSRSASPPPGAAPGSRTNVVPKAYQPRKVDMTTVDGYIDEELESYMMVNDMKPIQEERRPNQALPKDLPGLESKSSTTASPFVEDLQKQKETGSDRRYSIPENFTKKNKVWFDLLLFVASGILIIFLLEQLFKLALLTGMKKTVEALEILIQERSSLPSPSSSSS